MIEVFRIMVMRVDSLLVDVEAEPLPQCMPDKRSSMDEDEIA
jgi:hypothetical protein